MDRRPLKSRGTRWAAAASSFLARKGVRPNWISLGSVAFALVAAVAFASLQFTAARWQLIGLLVVGAACVQLRLLCNLLDGMVAVEGGLKTPAGEIFNDFPDRLSDLLILLGVGYCVGRAGPGPVLGWAAGAVALLTAYTRILGAAVGTRHYFLGPMAKPHRMAVITVAALLSVFECMTEFRGLVFRYALVLIILGGIVTVIRRLRMIVRDLGHGI